MRAWRGTKAEFDKRRYAIVDRYNIIDLTDWPRSLVMDKDSRGVSTNVDVVDLRGLVYVVEER